MSAPKRSYPAYTAAVNWRSGRPRQPSTSGSSASGEDGAGRLDLPHNSGLAWCESWHQSAMIENVSNTHRWRGTTTERGLGWDHQRQRRLRLAQLRDGDPCPRCGGPMFRGQPLDLDDFPGRAIGGPQVKVLSHRYCNRSAGSRLGAVLRTARPSAQSRPWPQARRW